MDNLDLIASGQEPAESSEEAMTPSEGGMAPPPSEMRLKAFLDQVQLRIFVASPGASSYVESFRVVPSEGVIELSLFKVPHEIIPAIQQAFGVQDVEVVRYSKAGHPCVGFRCKPTEEDLSALAIDDDSKVSDELRASVDGEYHTSVETEANKLLKSPGQPSAF